MKTIQLTAKTTCKHLMLYILAGFCLGILLIRGQATQSIFFFFLAWNLFLAYTPLGITSILRNNSSLVLKGIYFYPAFLCWLILLPNAPYIITDFIHLKKELSAPLWFDVLMLGSFSITGVLFGLAAMKEMFIMVEHRSGSRAAWATMAVTCALSGFGVYIGRFLRYNSWDILHRPMSLTADVFTSLFDAATFRPAWGITLGLGTLMFLLFNFYCYREK